MSHEILLENKEDNQTEDDLKLISPDLEVMVVGEGNGNEGGEKDPFLQVDASQGNGIREFDPIELELYPKQGSASKGDSDSRVFSRPRGDWSTGRRRRAIGEAGLKLIPSPQWSAVNTGRPDVGKERVAVEVQFMGSTPGSSKSGHRRRSSLRWEAEEEEKSPDYATTLDASKRGDTIEDQARRERDTDFMASLEDSLEEEWEDESESNTLDEGMESEHENIGLHNLFFNSYDTLSYGSHLDPDFSIPCSLTNQTIDVCSHPSDILPCSISKGKCVQGHKQSNSNNVVNSIPALRPSRDQNNRVTNEGGRAKTDKDYTSVDAAALLSSLQFSKRIICQQYRKRKSAQMRSRIGGTKGRRGTSTFL